MWRIVKVILFFYLLAASAEDIRDRTVSLPLALTLGILSAVPHLLARESFPAWIAGVLPGSFLIGAAYFTRQSVGYGDGLVTAVAGLCLGLQAGVAILMMALFLLCPVSLVLFIWKRDGKRTLPFVPFLFAAYLLWLVFG